MPWNYNLITARNSRDNHPRTDPRGTHSHRNRYLIMQRGLFTVCPLVSKWEAHTPDWMRMCFPASGMDFCRACINKIEQLGRSQKGTGEQENESAEHKEHFCCSFCILEQSLRRRQGLNKQLCDTKSWRDEVTWPATSKAKLLNRLQAKGFASGSCGQQTPIHPIVSPSGPQSSSIKVSAQ
jgi:hypothetical protein